MCRKVPGKRCRERSKMLNYMKKFTLEILPSLAATGLGAYIVNHYINKPDSPPPVAGVSSVETKKTDPNLDARAEQLPDAKGGKASDVKSSDVKPGDSAADANGA